MRHLVLFLATSSITGLAAFAGCSSGGSNGATGSAGSHTSSTSQSSTSSSGGTASSSSSASSGTGGGATGTGGSATGGGGTGGAAALWDCTVPSPTPSHGSCVTPDLGDGGELDAGVDNAGNASITNCNPFTNAGCAGTDICLPDLDFAHFYCQSAGTPANVPLCGECMGNATCAPGGTCAGSNANHVYCAPMCCTDADCGASGKCNTTDLPMAFGVGVCVPM